MITGDKKIPYKIEWAESHKRNGPYVGSPVGYVTSISPLWAGPFGKLKDRINPRGALPSCEDDHPYGIQADFLSDFPQAPPRRKDIIDDERSSSGNRELFKRFRESDAAPGNRVYCAEREFPPHDFGNRRNISVAKRITVDFEWEPSSAVRCKRSVFKEHAHLPEKNLGSLYNM